MPRDLEKARARQRRYRQKRKVEKFGLGSIGVDMRGRTGTQPRGSSHPRWNDARMISSDGYVKVRVGPEHPLADPNGYVYEHLLVWVSAGRERPAYGLVLHHRNEDKGDNRLSNLEQLTKVEHATRHHRMLSDDAVREIRTRYAAGEDGTVLAAEFSVPHARVYRLIKGETRLSAGGPISSGNLRGKKAAGRLLDGVERSGMPEVRHG